ncbi:MBL fold metallo-hydrolase [Halocatena marina]|uniref:MBL fold metallo-hydrolase n=2 Tax=Halocatena marina TaxID=2934937 RepID=UPI002225AA3D|nr:MBL fold metallo-hydrolase [Halocatena marina]
MSTVTVQLTHDVHWIEECYDIGGRHRHVSVYLIAAEEGNLLIDTGSFYHRDEITAELREATGGDGIDAIVLSHSDYPHSANVGEFNIESGDVELVASSEAPASQGLPDATKCEIGGQMDVLGRTLSFIDPPLADRSHTTWIYDHGDRVLFTADGLGNRHQPDECRYTSAEFRDGIPADEIYEFHRDELVWLRYVDPEKLRAALDDIFAAYPIDNVAPIHGNPIDSEDLTTYLERLTDAAGRISGNYEVPE